MKKLWGWLTDKDWKTWIGHFIAGFAIAWLLGPAATFAAFAYREGDDLWKHYRDPRPVGADYWSNPEVKRPWPGKFKDGFLDLWAPMAGAAVAEIVKSFR